MSRSVGEYYGFYRELRRVARKPHECCACEIPISPGDIYYTISAAFDGRIDDWKRCARCQFIHEQLRDICQSDDSWPDEKLNCGHTFEERWEHAPPAWMAALAFWQPGDPIPHVNRCECQHDDARFLAGHCGRQRHCRQWGRRAIDRCQVREGWRGIEGMRAHHNDAHANPCTEAA